MMEENPESLLIEIQEGLNRLEANLPNRVDGFAISPASKLPFKVLRYRAALMWRMAELVRCSVGHFKHGELASAILLTRAAMETTAAIWYLHKKVFASVRIWRSRRYRRVLDEAVNGHEERLGHASTR
jgi:hypothetical protein